MTQSQGSESEASLEGVELDELLQLVRAAVDVQDRRYGIPRRHYPACFVGDEAVPALVAAGIAGDEDEAVRLGNLLLGAGKFRHVQSAHAFKNEYLFYRFASDEDHGASAKKPDGSVVRWADFIAPLVGGASTGLSLLPSIPERDANFGMLAQEDLEACGLSPLDEHNLKLLDNTHPKAWVSPKPKERYNLVVIGGGSGGLVSAAGAAGVGGRVALIESHLLGGDCLNVGCVPSKALLKSAKAVAAIRHGDELGIRIRGEVEVDFGAVMERMRRLRASIAPHDSAERFSAELGIDVFLGRAKFTGKNTVEVDGKTLEFSKAVVATGGTAAIPDVPGLADAPYVTNATVFNLTQLPARLGVIGAGPIGLELAQAFQRFGSQVTVFVRGEKILPKEDPDAARVVEASVRRDGVELALRTDLVRVEHDGGKPPLRVTVRTAGEERTVELDGLLVAIGRKPSVTGLGLEEAGVRFDERLGIEVDDGLRTSNSNVFAVGDVATKYQFTHVSDFMARMVIRNALFFGREKFSSLLVPWATYTDPEVAHVGLYEKDLETQGIPYATFERRFADVDRAIVDGDTDGFVKIHVKKGSDEILGATIVGSRAGDMISEVTVAMKAKMGLGALANVIHPYPTAAEAIRQCGDAYNRGRLTPTVRSIFNRLMSLQR